MKRNRETEEDFDPVFIARWDADRTALYCKELKRLAAEAGLMEYPEMLRKIRAAEKAAAAAEEKYRLTRARARGEDRQATTGRKGKTQ